MLALQTNINIFDLYYLIRQLSILVAGSLSAIPDFHQDYVT